MEKIISLFCRNYDGDRLVRDEVVPGAEWVLAGEGIATRKWDGTCCRVKDGRLFKRYDAKKGKTPPPDFEEAGPPDPNTGHWPGWVPVKDTPEDRWFREAWERGHAIAEGTGAFGRVLDLTDGTYELCGPKVQGNPDAFAGHYLVRHGEAVLNDVPRDFAGIRAYFEANDWLEGIVWWHPDGRKVKVKRKDFGMKWGGR